MSLFTSALSAAAGPAVQGLFGLGGQAIQSAINQGSVSNAEAYNTQMADTVYSRGVEDMRNAGLNPVLAAGSPDPMSTAPVIPAPSAGSISSPTGQMASLTPSQDAQVKAQTLASTSQAAQNLVDAHLTQTKDQLAALDLPKAQVDADWYNKASGKTLGLWDDIDKTGINTSSALGAGLAGALAGTVSTQNAPAQGGVGPESARAAAVENSVAAGDTSAITSATGDNYMP